MLGICGLVASRLVETVLWWSVVGGEVRHGPLAYLVWKQKVDFRVGAGNRLLGNNPQGPGTHLLQTTGRFVRPLLGDQTES